MDDVTSEQPQGQTAAGAGNTDTGVPQAQAGARRLTRRTDSKVLGGVASGLAAYFDIDPIIMRLAFVAFGFMTWLLAVLLYLIAWAVVPPEDDPYRQRPGALTWMWIALAVFGSLLLLPLFFGLLLPMFFDRLGAGFNDPWSGGSWFDGFSFWRLGLFWSFMLVGLGVLLFRRSERATASSLEGGGAAATLPPSITSPQPARRLRPPSILGRLVVSAGLLVAGLAAVLENVGLLDLGARRLLALLLVVVGVGLLVGAWWGSARWLIAIGAVLVPILFAMSFFSANPGRAFRSGFQFGDRTEQPSTLAQVADPFEFGFGSLTLDLTALPLTDAPTEVTANGGGGQIEVLVPDDAAVEVHAKVGDGRYDIFGEERDGRSLTFDDAYPGPVGGGRLALDLHVGRGEIIVREQPAEAPLPSRTPSPSLQASPSS